MKAQLTAGHKAGQQSSMKPQEQSNQAQMKTHTHMPHVCVCVWEITKKLKQRIDKKKKEIKQIFRKMRFNQMGRWTSGHSWCCCCCCWCVGAWAWQLARASRCVSENVKRVRQQPSRTERNDSDAGRWIMQPVGAKCQNNASQRARPQQHWWLTTTTSGQGQAAGTEGGTALHVTKIKRLLGSNYVGIGAYAAYTQLSKQRKAGPELEEEEDQKQEQEQEQE